MDEYERATRELAEVVAALSAEDFARVRDPETTDDGCRSIRTVMHHVVRAGHGYAYMIRKAFGAAIERPVLEEPASASSRDRFRAKIRPRTRTGCFGGTADSHSMLRSPAPERRRT
jgi:hypothetical protein